MRAPPKATLSCQRFSANPERRSSEFGITCNHGRESLWTFVDVQVAQVVFAVVSGARPCSHLSASFILSPVQINSNAGEKTVCSPTSQASLRIPFLFRMTPHSLSPHPLPLHRVPASQPSVLLPRLLPMRLHLRMLHLRYNRNGSFRRLGPRRNRSLSPPPRVHPSACFNPSADASSLS